eukprot:1847679-Rhodomonas_salina.4
MDHDIQHIPGTRRVRRGSPQAQPSHLGRTTPTAEPHTRQSPRPETPLGAPAAQTLSRDLETGTLVDHAACAPLPMDTWTKRMRGTARQARG